MDTNFCGYYYENYSPNYAKVDNKKEKVEKAIALYKSGLTVYMVADEIGVTRETIQKWLKKNCIPIRGNKKYSYDLLCEIGNRWEAGETLPSLATEYGIKANVLKTKLFDFGFSKNNRRKPIEVFSKDGLLVGEFASISDASRELKLSVGAISLISRGLRENKNYDIYTKEA